MLAPLVQVTAHKALYPRALHVQACWQISFYNLFIVAGALTAQLEGGGAGY